MKNTLFILGLILSISSCAFNKLFLHPFPLETEDTFSDYFEDHNDTLTLSFNDMQKPSIKKSNGEPADLTYAIEQRNFTNSKDDTITGWLFKPKSYNGTTIYYLHGNAGHLPLNFPLMVPFVNKGYQVYMIDYSGFGFSQGKAKRRNVLKDANEGLDFLLAQKDIQFDNLLIYGQSLGGHLSAVVGTQNQDKINGLVIEGAFSSHKDVANDRVPFLARIFVREMYSAEKVLPNYKKPLLIIHSVEDKTVPIHHGRRLYEVASTDKRLYEIEHRHIYGPLYYADSIDIKMQQLLH